MKDYKYLVIFNDANNSVLQNDLKNTTTDLNNFI